jgi:S-formylglutathione hydrolase FrmB
MARRRPLPPCIGATALIAVALVRGAAALPTLRDGHGIHVEALLALDARQLAARVDTGALGRPVDVRILLPEDYDATTRRYPVLYLFHGTSGRAADWVSFGDAVETTAGLPLIVVMPDAGFDGDGGGWFADWFNGGAGGAPMWETFHVHEVVPWVDDNLRTVATRAGRAVAGLSQGGFGALSYAARHPDLFTSVASFSGGCVIDRDPQAIAIATTIIEFTTAVLSGAADPDAVFGPRATQEINWQAHDPGTLVTNLHGMQIALWTGDGTPGALDPTPPDPNAASIETITFGATRLFHGYLDAVGIHHAYTYYGGGTHVWPYWARDLREYLPALMRRFRHPPRRPRAIDHLAADDRWSVWGWDVSVVRPERTFDHLERARRTGFVLSGTGDATVRTPAFYPPGTRLRVSIRGSAADGVQLVRAGDDGRADVAVLLGIASAPLTARVRVR